jgi:hypothetical protein
MTLTKQCYLFIFLLEDIPSCLEHSNNKNIYTHIYVSVEFNYVFISLVATSFGCHEHRQAYAIKHIKKLATCTLILPL